jgi:hypothetical protein
MGAIIQAECGCGYKTGRIRLGIGFMPGTPKILISCPSCRALRSAAASTGDIRCPKCGREATELDRLAGEDDEDEVEFYRCPKCELRKLRIEIVLFWD